MKLYPFAIATAAVLGTAGVLVASGTAANEDQRNTTGTQLLINQRISQAAVRRSNSALNYLAPVRTTQSDAANTGRNGVTPLSRVTGAGKGWTTAQIADGAITAPKVANGAVTSAKLAGGAVGSAQLSSAVQAVVGNVHRIPTTRVAGGSSATLLDLGTIRFTGVCEFGVVNRANVGNGDWASVQVASTTGTWSGQGMIVSDGLSLTGSYLQANGVAANVATDLAQFVKLSGDPYGLGVLNAGLMRSDGASANLQVTAGIDLSLGSTYGGAGSCTFSGVVNT